jgi:hypothetical protein
VIIDVRVRTHAIVIISGDRGQSAVGVILSAKQTPSDRFLHDCQSLLCLPASASAACRRKTFYLPISIHFRVMLVREFFKGDV